MPFGFDKLRDLDHDGQPELFGDNPALLEYADGVDLCHAAYPPVYLILRWNGHALPTGEPAIPGGCAGGGCGEKEAVLWQT